MFKLILFAIIIVLACMGLAELLHLLWMSFIAPKSHLKTFYIVLLDDEDAVRQINYAGLQSNWLGRSFAEYRIAVYGNVPPTDNKECSNLAEKYDMIYCPKGLEGQILNTLSKE